MEDFGDGMGKNRGPKARCIAILFYLFYFLIYLYPPDVFYLIYFIF